MVCWPEIDVKTAILDKTMVGSSRTWFHSNRHVQNIWKRYLAHGITGISISKFGNFAQEARKTQLQDKLRVGFGWQTSHSIHHYLFIRK